MADAPKHERSTSMKTALIYRQAEMLFHGVQKARARFGTHLAADETIEAEVASVDSAF